MTSAATIARKHPSTAHVPGGGPDGMTCIQCVSFKRATGTKINGECRKATEFRPGQKPIADVSPSTAACKYFAMGTLV